MPYISIQQIVLTFNSDKTFRNTMSPHHNRMNTAEQVETRQKAGVLQAAVMIRCFLWHRCHTLSKAFDLKYSHILILILLTRFALIYTAHGLHGSIRRSADGFITSLAFFDRAKIKYLPSKILWWVCMLSHHEQTSPESTWKWAGARLFKPQRASVHLNPNKLGVKAPQKRVNSTTGVYGKMN